VNGSVVGVDLERLRRERLGRFQAAMRRRGLAAALLYNPANVRYVTGVDVMGVWAAGTFARYGVVPPTGRPILFEYPGAVGRSRRRADAVRPAVSWILSGADGPRKARRWARSIRSLMRELGASREPLAIDKLDATGLLALQAEGVRIADANDVAFEARLVKTRDEIALLRTNGRIGDQIMAEFEAAIRPGIREVELLAVLSDGLLRRGGESVFTRLVASGPNTNPWFSEARERKVRRGDLVAVDTDMNGVEGYLIDFSRTFLCGDRPTALQREAYRVAYECVRGMEELVRPGLSFGDFARAAPRLPERYVERRYVCMLHHAGLEDEGPAIPYPYGEGSEDELMPEGCFEAGMVVCLECFAGRKGAPHGVKLEDQVVVTKKGIERLSTYPFDERLLR
jgi:Xaa-Pro aminopeptidase